MSIKTSVKAKLNKLFYMNIKKMSLEEYKQYVWKKQGMNIGENVHIYSDIISKEPYMISIGSNTTISGDVTLITHDNSISKYLPQYTDRFGKISIGENCFIGMRSIILPGVTLADNTIVGAGTVVTKSITQSGCVLGGDPARVIGKIEDLKKNDLKRGYNIRNLSLEEKRIFLLENPERFITR